MAINRKLAPFNRFPVDFHYVEAGTHKHIPPKIVRYTRALYIDGQLKVWAEPKKGQVTLLYEKEVDLDNFVALDPHQAKWSDPDAERQFSLMKSSGCACKWNKLSLSKTSVPNV